MALVGYARVSTQDQHPDLQRDALAAAGCTRIFEDTASGARTDRPGLAQVLDYVRDGDVLVVWKLDRLGRSLSHLIETIAALQKGASAFARSPRRSTPPPPAVAWSSTFSAPSASSSATSSASAPVLVWRPPRPAAARAGASRWQPRTAWLALAP